MTKWPEKTGLKKRSNFKNKKVHNLGPPKINKKQETN